jgi:uncharacterized protein (TIGR03435 family)
MSWPSSSLRHSPLRAVLFCTALMLPFIPSVALIAQDSAHPQFEVVSIKRVDELRQGGGGRTMPDGSSVMTNRPVATFIMLASPERAVDVVGLPEWTRTERYDVTAKPPAGSTREQVAQMWRNMFADRMKLAAHIEQRERDVYSLVLARSDGKLGPELKPSSLDCSPPPPGTALPPLPAGPPSAKEALGRCGMMMQGGGIFSGGMPLNNLAASLRGLAGGEVENHTGLEGFYSVHLTFSPARGRGVPNSADSNDDAPDFFTALQEQLGLKLVHEKKMMPVFVIDHIERPSEN